MKLTVIDRKKLYRREYKRCSIQDFEDNSSDGCIYESLSRVVAQMIARG